MHYHPALTNFFSPVDPLVFYSLCMMAAPSLEHNPELLKEEQVDVAAVVASFFLAGGLTLGGFASFGIRGLICGCNPFVE